MLRFRLLGWEGGGVGGRFAIMVSTAYPCLATKYIIFNHTRKDLHTQRLDREGVIQARSMVYEAAKKRDY